MEDAERRARDGRAEPGVERKMAHGWSGDACKLNDRQSMAQVYFLGGIRGLHPRLRNRSPLGRRNRHLTLHARAGGSGRSNYRASPRWPRQQSRKVANEAGREYIYHCDPVVAAAALGGGSAAAPPMPRGKGKEDAPAEQGQGAGPSLAGPAAGECFEITLDVPTTVDRGEPGAIVRSLSQAPATPGLSLPLVTVLADVVNPLQRLPLDPRHFPFRPVPITVRCSSPTFRVRLVPGPRRPSKAVTRTAAEVFMRLGEEEALVGAGLEPDANDDDNLEWEDVGDTSPAAVAATK